jgi:RNA-directed DNA polymerase
MKRHGNLFEQIADPANIHRAYCKARRGRRWQNTVKTFERNLDQNLDRIRDSLIDKTFKTSNYREKIIHEPKTRTIYILPFYPDRIVQHAAMAVIAPIWDRMFIHDSYACRENKGMHLASKRVMRFMQSAKYCLHCDISKFYPTIDHDILYDLIQHKIKCKDTLWLLRDIIYSFPGGKNAPIGNLTSQWFGNLYMDELDQWVKNYWKIKHYVRYCDDFIVFCDDKSFLHTLRDQICEFLKTRLSLTFSKAEIYPVSTGVEFVGYRHFGDHVLLRKSTTKRIKKRIQSLPGRMKSGQITLDQMRSSVASTEGWLKWANTHNLSISLKLDKIKDQYGCAA